MTYNEQFMSFDRLFQQPFREISQRNDNHCEYFESLEQKLLEESQKLTNFMGKSLINDHSTKKLTLATSPGRKPPQPLKTINEDERPTPKPSRKPDPNKTEAPYMKRVKQLCSILRQPKSQMEESIKSPSKGAPRDREQSDRKMAYNILNIKENAHEEAKKEKRSRAQAEKTEKGRRLYRMMSDSHSLKDTISTESCKSLKLLDEHFGITQQRVKLEDLQILKYLAEGKFGSVYLVKHKKTNFLCALKRIPTSMLDNPKILTQRIRQIKIQSFLDHPNIVQLYSVFVEDNDLYLLMELCYSGNLYHHLKNEGRFGEEKIRSVVKQVCHAVQFMHDNDILHRDIKPQNILFHESIVKICDFGWSVNSPLLRDTLCGTPLYSSPEIVQKQQYDNKVDIWNIGVLTYELLFGKVPFEIRSEDDLCKIVDDQIYFPRSKPASPEIKDFVLHCLTKNPKERFSIAKLIDHEFLNPKQGVRPSY